jgi:hypothetical protein
MKLATSTGDLKKFYPKYTDCIKAVADAGFKYLDFDFYTEAREDSPFLQENWIDVVLDVKDYAKQKNIHVVLVAHPRKQNDFLRKESISGTADLTNIADNVFIIHRVGQDFAKRAGEFLGESKAQQYMNFSKELEVAKNRPMGVVDHLVGMYYEMESRRLKNSIAEHIIYGWQEEPTQVRIEYNESSESEPIEPFDAFEGEAPF